MRGRRGRDGKKAGRNSADSLAYKGQSPSQSPRDKIRWTRPRAESPMRNARRATRPTSSPGFCPATPDVRHRPPSVARLPEPVLDACATLPAVRKAPSICARVPSLRPTHASRLTSPSAHASPEYAAQCPSLLRTRACTDRFPRPTGVFAPAHPIVWYAHPVSQCLSSAYMLLAN